MVKYATKKASPKAPIATTHIVAATYEGDNGFLRDEKSELFLLGVHFMGEDKNEFYEKGDERQDRFVNLVGTVTQSDPAWMQEFIYFLRHTANMRTAPVVALAEYVRAGGEKGADLIGRVLHRADESGEILAYWLFKYGKPVPMAIRRGVAKHLQKLDEYSGMKYAGQGGKFSIADAIELTHPSPLTQAQSDLFEYLLDMRHHGDFRGSLSLLPMVSKNIDLKKIPEDKRREFLRANPDVLRDAGMTWERLSAWIPGGMDAEAWEAIIPNMGYMALLRNLRNFDQAKVSDAVANEICSRLSDPEQVAKSRQFPYRFWNAMENVPSFRWAGAIEKALDLSVSNIPELPGKTLVLVDISGSMRSHYQKGAIFGVAQHLRASGDLVAFGDHAEKVDIPSGASVLRGVQAVDRLFKSGHLGYGTQTWEAIDRFYDGHSRIVIVTDMQSFGGRGWYTDTSKKDVLLRGFTKANVPLYNFNMVGYRVANMETGSNGRYELGGLTDNTFRQIPLLEAGRNGTWPWEIN